MHCLPHTHNHTHNTGNPTAVNVCEPVPALWLQAPLCTHINDHVQAGCQCIPHAHISHCCMPQWYASCLKPPHPYIHAHCGTRTLSRRQPTKHHTNTPHQKGPTATRTCVNLSRFFGSMLLPTSFMSLSKQVARCGCLSGGWATIICCRSCRYTCITSIRIIMAC